MQRAYASRRVRKSRFLSRRDFTVQAYARLVVRIPDAPLLLANWHTASTKRTKRRNAIMLTRDIKYIIIHALMGRFFHTRTQLREQLLRQIRGGFLRGIDYRQSLGSTSAFERENQFPATHFYYSFV